MVTKKPYRKPEITQIKLVPEETMLSGCKQVSGAGGKTERCFPVTGACKIDSGS
ncbi:MAG: hypothetical protein KAS13_06230 [Candidatus Omnitrophica bacterium]|nr:hypothetical protein [Candidatus Omnitrophota bacterium]